MIILIGAFKDEKALSDIRADISVATLHLGLASSTITTLPVSSTASNIESSSRGDSVLKSKT